MFARIPRLLLRIPATLTRVPLAWMVLALIVLVIVHLAMRRRRREGLTDEERQRAADSLGMSLTDFNNEAWRIWTACQKQSWSKTRKEFNLKHSSPFKVACEMGKALRKVGSRLGGAERRKLKGCKKESRPKCFSGVPMCREVSGGEYAWKCSFVDSSKGKDGEITVFSYGAENDDFGVGEHDIQGAWTKNITRIDVPEGLVAELKRTDGKTIWLKKGKYERNFPEVDRIIVRRGVLTWTSPAT